MPSTGHSSVLNPFLIHTLHSKSWFTFLGNDDASLTLSICRILCFLLLRLCFRMSRDEVLCSVELLNLREIQSKCQLCKAEPFAILCPLPKPGRFPQTQKRLIIETPTASLQGTALLAAQLLLNPSMCCILASS